MEGTDKDPGVNPRAQHALFAMVNDSTIKWKYTLRITLIEIYNERVQDLLSDINNNLKVVQGRDGMEVLGVHMVRCLFYLFFFFFCFYFYFLFFYISITHPTPTID